MSFLALLTLDQHTPVEPFGGASDYDVSENYIVYTTKDPDLPEAWHTKQNVRSLTASHVLELACQLNVIGVPRGPLRQPKTARADFGQARRDA